MEHRWLGRGREHPLAVCRISKTNMISPLDTCHILPHPRVAAVEPLFLETAHFQKRMCTAFCAVLQCVIEVSILWSSKKGLSYSRAHMIHRSLNAILAQYKICHLELILRLSSKIQKMRPTRMTSGRVRFD